MKKTTGMKQWSESQAPEWSDLGGPGGVQVRAQAGAGPELHRLRVASQEKVRAERVVVEMVAAALAARHSWAEIGRAARITRQAAHVRWRSVETGPARDTSLERIRAAVADESPGEQQEAVEAARAAWHSWAEIAAAAGVSMKTARKRWGGIPKGRAGWGHPLGADGALKDVRTAILAVEAAARAERTAARAARAAGQSWDEIGRVTGLSRQGAHARWTS
ncbi:hypothetical protein [Nocardioides sp. 1609]|uniref:hypothetical protein n=1 Tax=Nocardioides sp. 1609 TaxID=2508327 RepID=UPI00106F2BFE|nr:hypothetical protein [Nocardioides sp. 1609]